LAKQAEQAEVIHVAEKLMTKSASLESQAWPNVLSRKFWRAPTQRTKREVVDEEERRRFVKNVFIVRKANLKKPDQLMIDLGFFTPFYLA